MNKHPYRLILASSSPRRKDLLNSAGLKLEIFSPAADEKPHRGESPRSMVKRLAREKAHSLAAPAMRRHPRAIIIAADTIVVAPGGKRIFGKPRDRKEATLMLRALSGRTHTVLTGYCLLEVTREPRSAVQFECVRVVRSDVTMRKLSPSQIAAYIASREPMDKAGAYAAQGIGQALIASIRGSYTNVVGLPLSHVLVDLENHFKMGLFLK